MVRTVTSAKPTSENSCLACCTPHIAPSPSTTGAEPVVNAFWALYIVGPIAVGGIWLWAFFGELQKRPMLPVMDPMLESAIEHGKGH